MKTLPDLGTVEDVWKLPRPQPAATCRTGKRVFSTRKAAELMLAARQDAPWPQKVPVRAYPCPDCHGWHLTSMPKEA